MRPIALTACCLLLMCGCSRSVSYDTDLQLKPLVQHKSGGELSPLEGAVSYAFPLADTTRWTVSSYQDAMDGILTDKSTDERLGGGIRGSYLTADGRLTWLSMFVSTPSVLLTVADASAHQYGYTQIELGENLTPLTVTVVFYPWTQAVSYKKGKWWMFNEDYVPPEESSLLLHPQSEAEQDGEPAELTNVKAFAFPGYSITEWMPASYDEAVNGIITRIGTDEIFGDGVEGRALTEEGRTNWLGLDVKSSSALVVAVDTRNKLYATAQLDPDPALTPREIPLVFQLWRDAASYPSGEWTVVDEFYVAPEQAPLQLNCAVQDQEGGTTQPLTGVKGYAYAGLNPSEWLPASYEDAVKGILTKTGTETTSQNGVSGRPFTDQQHSNWLGFQTAAAQTLVLAVDTEHRIYGYAVVNIDADNLPAVYEIVFQPWQQNEEYMSGDWIMVNEPYTSGGDAPARYMQRSHAKRP